MSVERIDSIARQTKFKQRTSFITPEAFINSIFFSNQHICPTLTEYSIDLEAQGIKSVTKQAIDKRFNKNTKSMLEFILADLISKQIKQCRISNNWAFSEIRIMDSTEFVLSKNLASAFPGYGGTGREAIAQVQFEYEITKGRINELSVASALESDYITGMKNIDCTPAKALLIRDLGYFAPKIFKEISQRQIYFISRAKVQWAFYEKINGRMLRLNYKDIIKRLKQRNSKFIDIPIYVGEQTKTPVRLIANLLSKEQTEKRLKRKRLNKGSLSKEIEESACLNLFVTNVERERCSSLDIYQYSLRWQIELVFKTWKSIMKIHKIHTMNSIRLECIILTKLIWVLINWSILKQIENGLRKEVSLQKLTRTLLSRSKILTMEILQTRNKLISWMQDLHQINIRHHIKEYKNGKIKISEFLYVL